MEPRSPVRPKVIPIRPTCEYESHLRARGYRSIAGIDEVGRGPLAGPVVAAAVILPECLSEDVCQDVDPGWIRRVRDSKTMTEGERHRVHEALGHAGVAMGLGAAGPEEIDRLGIVSATRLAMGRAVESLQPTPDHLLIDAVALPSLDIPQTSLIKGDAVSRTIAAASIVAKVTRDRIMAGPLDRRYPDYGFAANKGYGTPDHLLNLRRVGPSPVHRMSFAPIREGERSIR